VFPHCSEGALSMTLFDTAVSAIVREYDSLCHQLGWRFLGVARKHLAAATSIAFITANPGGTYAPGDHPTQSCEHGSAYLVEKWLGGMTDGF
jgi:hypothetical protein